MAQRILAAAMLAGSFSLACSGTFAQAVDQSGGVDQQSSAQSTTTLPSKTFKLTVNPGIANLAHCLAPAGGPLPVATVTVTEGNLNDTLKISVTGLKPGLKFDLFTVQRSNADAQGHLVTGFTNFGLAWYQSDLDANAQGTAQATIHTILVNQIFGFDPDVSLAPVNTFHVGFWFNNPADAAPCGFTGTTPFNGEHNAGPLAMISRPNATTGLGPLCFSPNTNHSPPTCNP